MKCFLFLLLACLVLSCEVTCDPRMDEFEFRIQDVKTQRVLFPVTAASIVRVRTPSGEPILAVRRDSSAVWSGGSETFFIEAVPGDIDTVRVEFRTGESRQSCSYRILETVYFNGKVAPAKNPPNSYEKGTFDLIKL